MVRVVKNVFQLVESVTAGNPVEMVKDFRAQFLFKCAQHVLSGRGGGLFSSEHLIIAWQTAEHEGFIPGNDAAELWMEVQPTVSRSQSSRRVVCWILYSIDRSFASALPRLS